MKARIQELRKLIKKYADLAELETNANLKKNYEEKYNSLKEQAFELYLNFGN